MIIACLSIKGIQVYRTCKFLDLMHHYRRGPYIIAQVLSYKSSFTEPRLQGLSGKSMTHPSQITKSTLGTYLQALLATST